MCGEFGYEDKLVFPNEVVIERFNGVLLVIGVETANWLVLNSDVQLLFLNKLRGGSTIGEIVDTIENEDDMEAFKSLLAAVFARKFAGVNEKPKTEFLEGYRMLNLYLTNACNLSCYHCFMNSGKKNEGELSVEDWKSVLREFRNNNGLNVTFSGGEPLMYKGFDEILKYAKTIGLETTVLTNGVLWTDDRIQDLAPYIDEVQISIDGVDENTNAVIRGKGNFEKAANSVVNFANIGVKTSVSTTFAADNLSSDTAYRYKKMIESIDRLTNSKVFFKLSKKILPGRNVVLSLADNEAYSKKIKAIERMVRPTADYENFMVGHSPNLVAVNCGLGGISVASDGQVYFCNRISELESYGHVNEHPLAYFMKKGRDIHQATSVDRVEPCSSCYLRYICDGGCRIDDFNFRGKIKEANQSFKQISCTQEKMCNLKQRMIDSFNYFYDFG